MAMNPSSFSFTLLSLCTLFSTTLVSSSISYSQHCASVVPEPTPTAPLAIPFLYPSPILGKCTGGDKILSNDISSEDFFRFNPTQNIFETDMPGVYRIEAFLVFESSGSSFPGKPRRRISLTFALDGFWSEFSGKLCMVGSASFYTNSGEKLNLNAVLKLNYAVNLTIFSGLITGKLESLASPNDSNYFEPISLLEFVSSTNYQYSLVSGHGSDCGGGTDIPKDQSLGLPPGQFCSALRRGSYQIFDLEYLNECSSSKSCTPLGQDNDGKLPREMTLRDFHCSEEEHRLQYVIKFGSEYLGWSFDPVTTLVGEGSWDVTKNQLCIVACRFLNSTGSSDNARVGDCSIRLSMRFSALWTIKSRASIFGQIWTNFTSNSPGYFSSITFRSRDIDSMAPIPGLRYQYTVIEKVRKLCPFKPVINKGNRYPKWKSNDMYSFDMYVLGDSTGNHSWTSYATGSSFYGDQNYVRSPFDRWTSMNDNTEVEGKHGPLNITYKIVLQRSSSNGSIIPNRTLDISAEGLYEEETGKVCMIGCRKLSTDESMDCELLLKYQFPPVKANEVGKISSGSIESLREETDPLYFKYLQINGRHFYAEEAKRSVERLDLENMMVLISNTLACLSVASQNFYVKRNPQVLSFASLFMLLILTLGHMVTLLLNFASLFLGNHNGEEWFEMNQVTMVSFLFQLRLLCLAFSARSGDQNQKDIWVAEKKAFFVSAPLYALGLLFILVLYPTNLVSYGGLVLDGFLLPQILINIFHASKVSALSRLFYIGTTCARLLPHVYDLYRAHYFARAHFDWTYIFANPHVDFFSLSWDVVISCGGILFVVLIYLHQRPGGRYILRRRFREVAVCEMVPVTSNEK